MQSHECASLPPASRGSEARALQGRQPADAGMLGWTQEQVRRRASVSCSLHQQRRCRIRWIDQRRWVLDRQVREPQHEVVADGFDDHVAGVIWAVFR